MSLEASTGAFVFLRSTGAFVTTPCSRPPWQKVGADIFTLYDKDYLLVGDCFYKFPEICHLDCKTAPLVDVKNKSIFACHEIPDESVNMPFNSSAMKTFAKE